MSDEAAKAPTNGLPLVQRLRAGFGGLVPAVCDEAANELERMQQEIERLKDERG